MDVRGVYEVGDKMLVYERRPSHLHIYVLSRLLVEEVLHFE